MNIDGTAYDIIANICGLMHEGDDIYVDIHGKKFFLNRYGFHTAIQVAPFVLQQKKERLNHLIEKAERQDASMNAGDLIGLKSRKKIRTIIAASHMGEKEKLHLISQVVKEQT